MNNQVANIIGDNQLKKRTKVLTDCEYVLVGEAYELQEAIGTTVVYEGYPTSMEIPDSQEGFAIKKIKIVKSASGIADSDSTIEDITETWLNNDNRKIYAFEGDNIKF